jgi:serine/threonine protein kinase
VFKTTVIEPGQRLGKYLVISELGQGGMGCVYLAEDESLSRQVAIKVIKHHDGTDDSFVEKLAHEAKVIANLSHPNVVHVNSFDVIAGVPIIEMEYIEGGSLSQRFQDEFVLPAEAVRYAYGVSNALAYSHSMGAIHRDVKPSNILIDHHEQARLADFGIAKAIADSEMLALTNSRSGVFRGTPHYAPPEAWEGQDPTEAWDIYSLGAVLYEAVTGTPPHVAATPLELARKMVTEDVQPARDLNPKISPELGSLIDDQLMGDAADRPINAEEVAARIERLPEFGRDTDHRHSTVRIKIQKPTRITRLRKRIGRRIPKYIAAASILIVGMFWAQWWITSAVERGQNQSDHPAILTQDDAGGAPVQDSSLLAAGSNLEALLHTTKRESNHVIMTARYSGPESDATERWLVSMTDKNRPTTIAGYNDSRLFHMNLEKNETAYDVTGDWAGFGDSMGTVFRRGSIRGLLHWQEATNILLGNISFIGHHDGTVQETVVSAIAADKNETDTHFIYHLEESDHLTPLLYNELMPRNTAWSDKFDDMIPSFTGGIARIERIVPNAETPPDADFNYAALARLAEDGEALPINLIAGIPHGLRPLAQFSQTIDGLTAELACKLPKDSNGVRLEILMARTPLVPLSATPVLKLIHHTRDNANYEYYGLPNEAPVSPLCTVQSEQRDGTVTFQISIPYDAFRMDSDPPRPGERMRFAAKVYGSENSDLIAQWGFPHDGVAKHGAVLRFEN